MKIAFVLRRSLITCGMLLVPLTQGLAQSQNEAAVLWGEGAYLRGLGSYNLNTAKADRINVETVSRWKEVLRKDLENYRKDREAKEAKTKQRHADVRTQQQLRQDQLRLNPSASDIQNGQALNALFFDLVDPDIKAEDWSYRTVSMPKGVSVKNLIFTFTPLSNASLASKALSRGVVSLSRLEVEGNNWPTVLKQEELALERRDYERAYAKLRDNLVENKSINNEVIALDLALDSLKRKVSAVVPEKRDYRREALKYWKDLYDATRMFDAATVDYSREILAETRDQDAMTVSELVSFMLKYRLQFASAESLPEGRELYRIVYEAMQKQMQALKGAAPPQESEVDLIIRQHGNAYYVAADKLINAFDRQVRDLQESATMKPEEKDRKIEVVKMERVHFEGNGTIPFSSVMRDDVIKYLSDLKTADESASKAILNLKQNDKLADRKKLIEPFVVGKWDFVSQVDRNFRFSWTLYSDGSINQGKSRWMLNQSTLLGTHPNNKAPGGAWIDTCLIDENGQQLSARNQLGHPFKGSRVD